MESWRTVWRKAAPLLPTKGLEALGRALRADDPRLVQGCTTPPPPLVCVQGWPTEAACLLGYCGWQSGTLKDETVECVEEFFARTCYEIDQIMGKPADCRWLLNWYDETPRDRMRAELLPEVELELARRSKE